MKCTSFQTGNKRIICSEEIIKNEQYCKKHIDNFYNQCKHVKHNFSQCENISEKNMNQCFRHLPFEMPTNEKLQELIENASEQNKTKYKEFKEAAENVGHKLYMIPEECTNIKKIRLFCLTTNSIGFNHLYQLKRGGGSCCGYIRKVKTNKHIITEETKNSTDVAVVRKNELAKKKADVDVIKEYAEKTIEISLKIKDNNNQNKNYKKYIQIADIIIEVSKANDGWVYVGYNNEYKYYINRDGRFGSVLLTTNSHIYEHKNSFREKYTQIELGGTRRMIHREFAINFSVVDFDIFRNLEFSKYFQEIELKTFKEEWLTLKYKIPDKYITTIKNVFDKIENYSSVTHILVPTVALTADHTVPNSHELYTAVQLTPYNNRKAVDRNEIKTGQECVLFDVSTKTVVPLSNYENKETYIFPSIRTIAEAICKQFNIDNNHPKNLIIPSIKKATNFFAQFDMFPQKIELNKCRTPNFAELIKKEYIVITGC